MSRRTNKYQTYEEAKSAAIAVYFMSSYDYINRYKIDPKLPSTPSHFYSDFYEKGGWPDFLGIQTPVKKYTWEEASAATIKLSLNYCPKHYKNRCQIDSKLPRNPERTFADVWVRNGGWSGYFGKVLGSIEIRKMLNELGITNMEGYNKIVHLKLPEDPLKAYDLETFEELLTIKEYDIEEVKAYCKRKGFQLLKKYKEVSLVQQHLPSVKLLKGYVSSKSIITKLSPFDLAKKEHPDYSLWFDMANKVVLSGRGISSKTSLYISFIKDYIIELEQPTEPSYFFDNNHQPPLLAHYLEKNSTSKENQRSVNSLHEFIDCTFHEYCQDEDDDGLVDTLPGYTNKWLKMASNVEVIKPNRTDKSNKWPLAINYIERAAKFLIPENAKSFQDVKHIDADWFEVDESVIDKGDPNCVWRTRELKLGGKVTQVKYDMWSPVRTCALFVLFSMPLRGQQICWLDSGEADPEIPIINSQNEVVWVKNDSHLVNDVNKRSERQGFLRCFKKARSTTIINKNGVNETKYVDIIGSYITTNKTSIDGSGYEVAYMPLQLIKWMIRLRDWQSKYNPIDKLTSWQTVELKRDKNPKILDLMKSQAFLFRNAGSLHVEDKAQPMNRQTAITSIFAWVMYNIQDADVPLAYLPEGESPGCTYNYKSDFTPHGMRVSFISAYVIDAKLPISVVAALVGHASLVMTIYYSVTTNQNYYEILSSGHQSALSAAPARVAALLKNKQLKLSSSDFFDSNGQPVKEMYDKAPYASLGFKDFGVCPVSCSKCHEGGEEIKENSNIYSPVRAGYLGPSNCFACRFFITGPAYIGGLKTILAEVNLEATESSKRLEKFRIEKEELEDMMYISRKDDLPFKHEAKLNNIQTLYLQETEKFDVLSQDCVLIAIMAFRSGEILKDLVEKPDKKRHQLILAAENPILGIEIDEVSEFAHMTEICQNAEFYSCSNPSRALPKRTKMLDMFALNNGFSPKLFQLTDEEQLKVGNQMTSIMLSRLRGSWDTVDRLMDGSISLKDLGLSAKEIMEPMILAFNHWTSKTEHQIEVVNV